MRKIKVAAAQMGGIPSSIIGDINAQKINEILINGTPSEKLTATEALKNINITAIRNYNIERMLALMKSARHHRCDLVVFPELALTSFFPYFWIEDEEILLKFFEEDDKFLNNIRYAAREIGISAAFGYCEKIIEQRKNILELYLPDTEENSFKYHKVHLPGFDRPKPNEKTFQFEKRYFHPGSEYPVRDVLFSSGVEVKIGMTVCHDRRYSNPYLIMGLKKVEIILNGYNTPFYLTFNDKLDGDVYKFHYFPLQAHAITEGTFIVSVARAGDVFGHRQIAGSCIISPDGEIMAKTEKLGEDIIFAELDLDWCHIVRDQKYQGGRAMPEVLKSELDKFLK